ncbi:MAG: ABC transporter ATP-binding protein [Armatimonadota bacterium]|nr:ABC transporter ATP-binding protein [bacterium]MDW8322084.1 ABC transporter ATP-binding protein [Armatimonadota bacterium]
MARTMESAIKIEGLTKEYLNKTTGKMVRAVDDLHLEVYRGEIFGFLGPNGAGKTTTIKMLLGLIFPTKGDAWIFGKPIGDVSVKRQIAYLPESPYFYEYLTGRQVLDFYARLFGVPASERKKKVDALLEMVGLSRDGDKTLRNYSKGMLQRIGIAQALLNDPELLFLDEPTSGLDPMARIEIRDLIIRLKQQGKTVFLSSHQLLEVELICDRVSILNRGKLLKAGKLDELLPSGRVEIVAENVSDDGVIAKIRDAGGMVQRQDGRIVVQQPDDASVNKVVDIIRSANGTIRSLTPQRRTLEELFVSTIEEVEKR